MQGYSTTSRPYRVYNIRTCSVEESNNVVVNDFEATYEQGNLPMVLSNHENEKWKLKNPKRIKESTLLNLVLRIKSKKVNFNLRTKGSARDCHVETSLVIQTLE